MKKWLQIVQKYIYATITSMFGILFIYALIFATPVAGLVYTLVMSNGDPITSKRIENFRTEHPYTQIIVDDTETFCRSLMIIAIIGLILGGITLFFRSNLRKRFYWTNFITNSLLAVYSIGVASWLIYFLADYSSILLKLDIATINEFVVGRQANPAVVGFGFYHILGFILAFLLLVLIVFVIIIIINKIKYEIEWNKKYSKEN